MKNAAYLREFAKYVSLNVLGMAGLSCYILADTFFVARGLGANGLTALNLAIPVYSFIHGVGLMLGMGGATKYAIQKSQKETAGANRTFTTALLLGLGFAAAFFLTGALFSAPLAGALGAKGAVLEMSRTYLRVILLFAPAFLLNDLLLCFVRNDGAPQRSMLAMLGGSLSNILLDYIFIFPFDMGILGAVLATGLAPVISILILLPFFAQKKNGFHAIRRGASGQLACGIVSNGLPSLVTEVSSGVVIIVFNLLLLGLQGDTGVAAYGVIANLSLVVIAVFTGVAQGVQPILSRNYGTGNREGVRQTLRYALMTLFVLSILIYAGVFLGAPQIVTAFNSERNELLQRLAVPGLKIYFTGGAFAGVNILLSVYFTSTEDARPAHLISLLRGFAIIVPLAFLFSTVGGATGVWCAFPVTELLVSGAALVLYGRYKKAAPV